MTRHLSYFAVIAAMLAAAARAATPLEVCLSDNDLPPFAFRPQGSATGAAPRGVAMDLLYEALPASEFQLNITPLPWRRCLRNLEAGTAHIAVNAFEGGQAKWRASLPYVDLHNVYLFSRQRFKHGVSIASADGLSRYNICGLTTRDEARYKLGVAKYDDGALNFRALVAKLHAGRCDLVLESRETLAGIFLLDKSLKELVQDPALDEMPLPGTPVSPLRFLVSQRAPDAALLQKRMDDTIKAKQAGKGGIAKLVNTYLQ